MRTIKSYLPNSKIAVRSTRHFFNKKYVESPELPIAITIVAAIFVCFTVAAAIAYDNNQPKLQAFVGYEVIAMLGLACATLVYSAFSPAWRKRSLEEETSKDNEEL